MTKSASFPAGPDGVAGAGYRPVCRGVSHAAAAAAAGGAGAAGVGDSLLTAGTLGRPAAVLSGRNVMQ